MGRTALGPIHSRHSYLEDFRIACSVVLQVFLSRDHLCIVLEYASAGELFESVREAGRFDEDMARFFFQQLIAGTHTPASHCLVVESLFPSGLA